MKDLNHYKDWVYSLRLIETHLNGLKEKATKSSQWNFALVCVFINCKLSSEITLWIWNKLINSHPLQSWVEGKISEALTVIDLLINWIVFCKLFTFVLSFYSKSSFGFYVLYSSALFEYFCWCCHSNFRFDRCRCLLNTICWER